jgi:hypothetical protein
MDNTEVVADRMPDTPDWVWSPPETVYHEHYVEILLDAPGGLKRAIGIYRKGTFWGKEVEGWFAPETISANGRPSHHMYVDGFVKGWRPYRYHLNSEKQDG